MEEGADPPLPFDEFKNDIDTRGGYLQKLAESISCFKQEIIEAVNRRQMEGAMMLKQLKHRSGSFENCAHRDTTLLCTVRFKEQLQCSIR